VSALLGYLWSARWSLPAAARGHDAAMKHARVSAEAARSVEPLLGGCCATAGASRALSRQAQLERPD
jgi:hypothetical protein